MPANGTAGLARSAVSGISRLPSPPARTIARTLLRLAGLMLCHVSHVERLADRGSVRHVRVDILTKEYPPAIYGGAGVHVAELVRALRGLAGLDVQVQAFGAPRAEPGVMAYADLPELGA